MTALDEIGDRLAEQLGRRSDTARAKIAQALRDAYDLATLSAGGSPADDTQPITSPADMPRGFVARATHTINPQQLAEHGENALTAWIRQAMRELAAEGANPFAGTTLQIDVVPMGDGTIVVTGEGRIA